MQAQLYTHQKVRARPEDIATVTTLDLVDHITIAHIG